MKWIHDIIWLIETFSVQNWIAEMNEVFRNAVYYVWKFLVLKPALEGMYSFLFPRWNHSQMANKWSCDSEYNGITFEIRFIFEQHQEHIIKMLSGEVTCGFCYSKLQFWHWYWRKQWELVEIFKLFGHNNDLLVNNDAGLLLKIRSLWPYDGIRQKPETLNKQMC